MPSSDSNTTIGLSGNEPLLVAVGVGGVVFLVLAVVLGFGGAFGAVFTVLYVGLTLAITAFVLWLFYRLVVAAERIANAQQRIARLNERSSSVDRK